MTRLSIAMAAVTSSHVDLYAARTDRRLRLFMTAAALGYPPCILSGYTFSHFDTEIIRTYETSAVTDPNVALEVAAALSSYGSD